MNESGKNAEKGDDFSIIYGRYCRQIDKEDKLVNDRVNWLLTSQSLLFAAVGLSAKAGLSIFGLVVPVVGCVSSLLVWWSLWGATQSLRQYRDNLYKNRDRLLDKEIEEKNKVYPQLHRDKHNLNLGLVAPKFLPIVFALAWTYLLIFLVLERFCYLVLDRFGYSFF